MCLRTFSKIRGSSASYDFLKPCDRKNKALAINCLLKDYPIRKAYWKQSEWKFRNFHFNSRVLWDKIFTICIQNWCLWFLRMNRSESKWRFIIVFFLEIFFFLDFEAYIYFWQLNFYVIGGAYVCSVLFSKNLSILLYLSRNDRKL